MKKITRDHQGGEKMYELLKTMKVLATAQAAKALNITPAAASARLGTLVRQGRADRIKRGTFVPHNFGLPRVQATITPTEDNLEELLKRLEAERTVLDNKIIVVQATIGLLEEHK